MSRTRLEKNPDLTCNYMWGGTPDLNAWDNGWSCPHVCHLPLHHNGLHNCCGNLHDDSEDYE